MPAVRRRFWVETAVATVGLTLTLITLVLPDWIELMFGVDPDNGSGTAEWLVVGITVAVTAIASVAARREWRLAQT